MVRPSVYPVAVFAACLLLSACATGRQEPDMQGKSWSQERATVLQSIQDIQKQAKQHKEDMQADHQLLNRRLNEMRGKIHRLEAVTAAEKEKLAALRHQVRRLRAEIRGLESVTAKLKKSRKANTRKMDKKIETIAKAVQPQEAITVHNEDEKNRYTEAYLALKSGNYDEAIKDFRALLKNYPHGEYNDQAYYWIAESYLAQNNLERAVGNLEWMVAHYPKSAKHAVAMLKLGKAYQKQGRRKESSDIWLRLIQEHPDSQAAEEARKLWKALPGKH